MSEEIRRERSSARQCNEAGKNPLTKNMKNGFQLIVIHFYIFWRKSVFVLLLCSQQECIFLDFIQPECLFDFIFFCIFCTDFQGIDVLSKSCRSPTTIQKFVINKI